MSIPKIEATNLLRGLRDGGRTIEDYIRCFRHIVAEIFEIDGGTKKYDYRTGARQRWVDRIDAIELASITPALVQKWKIDFLNRADSNPAKRRVACISVNSLLRQARSLFSPKRLKFVKISDVQSPFEGIELEPRQSMRYRSSLKIYDLLEPAMAELGQEELKVFLLASMAGLRRNEIDQLSWTAFNWDRCTLRVEVVFAHDTMTIELCAGVGMIRCPYSGFGEKNQLLLTRWECPERSGLVPNAFKGFTTLALFCCPILSAVHRARL